MSLKARLMLLACLSPFYLAACSGAQLASTVPARPKSVCDMADHGKQLNGETVRLKAVYITDLRHGALLKDPKCPSMVIEQGTDTVAGSDASVARFDDAVTGNILDHSLREFSVEISGKFTWSERDKPDEDVAAAKRRPNPPYGIITIEKVWSFVRLKSNQK